MKSVVLDAPPRPAAVRQPAELPAARPVAVIVVGAGRSGTSVLTAGVGALGVNLGDRLKAGGMVKNPKGFFEDTELLDLNARVHRLFGLRASGANVRPIEERAWRAVDLGGLAGEAVAIIERRLADERLWGLKSGGLLRLLPFWQEVLETAGVEARYVLALRNPLGVADSRANLDFYRGFQEKSDLEWLIQVIPYIDRLRGHPLVAVDYDLLMADPAMQLGRIARALDLPRTEAVEADIERYAREFATKGLYHHRHEPAELDEDERVNPLTADAYRVLHALASDRLAPDDPELWARLAEIQAGFAAMAPALRYIDYLEDELRGRYWGFAELWQKMMPRLALGRDRKARLAG